MKKKAKRPSRWRRRLGSLAAGGAVATVVGLLVFVVVYSQMSGDGGNDEFVGDVVETPSESQGDEPFEGGPRLYFPVQGVDFGQVPFQTEVSHTFDLKNIGDATLQIQDIQVNMLEGC